MNSEQIVKSFAGQKRGHGSERHSIKSLSKRLLTSRQTVREMIRAGELPMRAQFGTGNTRSYEFSSASLDTMRESIVEEIVREIVARLQGLNMSEQEMVLTALHGLRAHSADIETEFSSKPNEDDDDESTTQEVAKLIGGAGGAVAGASLGGRYAGLAGMVGGGIAGGTVGSTAAGNRDLRRGALAGAGLYAVDKVIRNAGGYAVVGQSANALRGRIVDALRRAAAKAV